MSNPKPVVSSQLIEHPEFTNRLMNRVTELEAENESLKANLAEMTKMNQAHFCNGSIRDYPWVLCSMHRGSNYKGAVHLLYTDSEAFNELKNKLGDREKMVEVLKQYRHSEPKYDHRYCREGVVYPEGTYDDRCSTCKLADALLLEGK